MAKLPPKKSEENTGEWLNTYADMVTLLLTFFVLLFACSNMDETKIQYVFQAFRVNGRYVNTVVAKPSVDNPVEGDGNSDDPGSQGGEGELPQSYDELYQYLSDYIAENQLGESVSIEQGATTITIRFQDNVFFDGDSYRLKAEGRQMLDGFIPALKAVNRSIRNVIVAGHTAYVPNPTMDVYMLSSMRAVSVRAYLGTKNTVDEEKYVCHGYGPNKPVADNDTADGKRQNRRVELIITRNNEELDLSDPEVIKDLLEHEFNIKNDKYDVLGGDKVDPTTLPDGSADKIIDQIEKDFSDSGISGGTYRPGSIDLDTFKIEVEDSSADK
ncbi:MAG: OmpA family protein [Oscillospiraceae bacterium]|nr:OmpA family protein [Oscillospiraceae bacterium]